jgi:protein-S-isoprenylcysteine O-methyltransferase Ste14
VRLSQIFVFSLLVVWLAYGGWTTARTYRNGGRQDRGSKRVFVAGIFSPFVVGFLVTQGGLGLPFPAHAAALEWAGGTVMLAGIVLWMRAIATLGRYFSVNVDIPEDHRLVDTGVYAWVRHPAYAGMIITEAGFGIASADAVVAIAFLLIPAAAFLHRIGVEERALEVHLGDSYRSYASRTRRLVPFVY